MAIQKNEVFQKPTRQLRCAREFLFTPMTIIESIESVFADVPYPGDDRIAEHKDCPECDDIRAHFRGSKWRGHTVNELQQYQSALSLFTSEALHYFLPAFMLVSLGAWDEADDIPFSIMCIFLPSDAESDASQRQYRQERFEIFTQRQREAVASYLREWANSASLSKEVHRHDITRAIEILRSGGHGA
jgi:hypothetical protein